MKRSFISHQDHGAVVGVAPYASETFYAKLDPNWNFIMSFKSAEQANQMLGVIVSSEHDRKLCSIKEIEFDGEKVPVEYLRENGFEDEVAPTSSPRP
jgi:hypothetical protein